MITESYLHVVNDRNVVHEIVTTYDGQGQKPQDTSKVKVGFYKNYM